MDVSKAREPFRRAMAGDAAAMREGLEPMLGTGGHGGLSPEREYGLRRPDFVMDIPQPRERIRGRDTVRTMQETFPAPRASHHPARSHRRPPCLGRGGRHRVRRRPGPCGHHHRTRRPWTDRQGDTLLHRTVRGPRLARRRGGGDGLTPAVHSRPARSCAGSSLVLQVVGVFHVWGLLSP